MGDERIMAILSIEWELSGDINLEAVVTEFARLDSNRRISLIKHN